jgi:GxxExxY protein
MSHPNDTNKNQISLSSTKIRSGKIIHPDLSYRITGVIFQTQNELGRFRNEKQYCDKIEFLLKELDIPYQRELILDPSFEGENPGRSKVDFLIDNKIILEIKSKPFITKNDYYQTQRYLVSLDKDLAILVNMRRHHIHPKRILNTQKGHPKHSSKNL